MWSNELEKLGQTKTRWGKPKKQLVFVVCYAEEFKTKLRQGDLKEGYWSATHPGFTKWEYHDFDPAYALDGEEADSIMDWERRIILKMVQQYSNLRIRYIDPTGGAGGGAR
jgi:hypothetical protein